MKIIGISGTNGAGKDIVGQILKKDFGFGFVNVSDFLRQEAGKRKLEPTRENLRMISSTWRREMGVGVLVDMAVDFLKASNQNYPGIVISPMRNSGEAGHLKEIGGTLVWVDAQPRLRHERVISRSRDAESHISYEQFIAAENAEMNNTGDDTMLDMAAVKAMADIKIENNGSLEELKQKVVKAFGLA